VTAAVILHPDDVTVCRSAVLVLTKALVEQLADAYEQRRFDTVRELLDMQDRLLITFGRLTPNDPTARTGIEQLLAGADSLRADLAVMAKDDEGGGA
jgi:hypothetical protein